MSESADERITAVLKLCDEVDAANQHNWRDYGRWLTGMSTKSQVEAPNFDTATVRAMLTGIS